MSPVTVILAAPVQLAIVRRRARASELATLVPQCCGLVWNVLRAQGVKGGRHVAVYLNGDIDLEVGAEVGADFVESGEVVRSSTPAGPAATVTHLGPYRDLGAAHAAIRDWCARNGRTPTGCNWEVYGHWESAWDADPSRIRTDVFCQLR